MDAEKRALIESELSQAVLERWSQRADVRVPRLARAAKIGALAAAPEEERIARIQHASIAEGKTYEATSGTYDIDAINFLRRGQIAARTVCRVVHRGIPLGTGFLVAPGLVITNKHVIADVDECDGILLQFNCELDENERPMQIVEFELAPSELFVSSPNRILDFTLIAVRPIAVSGESIFSFGWLPFDSRKHKIIEGEPAVIIQHPQGEDKKICLFDSLLIDRFKKPDEPYIQYTTDTEHGASGSPVFNRHWQIVGLHHASVDVTDDGRRRTINEGVRVSEIIRALQSGVALIATNEAMPAQALARMTAIEVLANGRPQLGTAIAERPGVSSLETRSLEGARTRIITPGLEHYIDRDGYDEHFLGDADALLAPLPKLSSGIEDDAAPLSNNRGQYVLKYEHYSVVMSASRRLAYFSAVNIDGPTMPKTYNRKFRVDEDELGEHRQFERAADQWYFDPRIARDYQLGPEIYDDPKTLFAFGHITRRSDAVWGRSDAEFLLANDDTFHLTNCAPQVASFNSGGDWGRLENKIDTFARAGNRLCVLSGPVLGSRDPEILGVKVPLSYWKVIAFSDGNRLRSIGFMTSQKELVGDEGKKLESLRTAIGKLVVEANAEGWIVPVRDIARDTSLDFGSLAESDVSISQGNRRRKISDRVLDELFGDT